MLSALFELLVSALYAPVTMLMQSRQLAEIALGRDSGWNLQSRGGESVPWTTAIGRHWLHTLTGVAVTVALFWLDPGILPWMAPILLGLVLSIPLSRWSGSERIGRALKRRGLLLTPDERVVPSEFRRRAWQRRHYARLVASSGLRSVLVDPAARERHYRNVLPAAPRAPDDLDVHRLVAERKLEQRGSVDEILGRLAQPELMRVLGDAELCRRLVGARSSGNVEQGAALV